MGDKPKPDPDAILHRTLNNACRKWGAREIRLRYTGSRYAGHAIGTAIKISDGYDPGRPKETVGSDWALVSLDKKLGSEGRVLAILNELPENGTKVALGGYQKDHSLILMADTRCQIIGRFVDAGDRLLLRHNCAVT